MIKCPELKFYKCVCFSPFYCKLLKFVCLFINNRKKRKRKEKFLLDREKTVGKILTAKMTFSFIKMSIELKLKLKLKMRLVNSCFFLNE